jgi:hypothetical protein
MKVEVERQIKGRTVRAQKYILTMHESNVTTID